MTTKTNYILTLWKTDKRTKTGLTKIKDYTFTDRTEQDMEIAVACINTGSKYSVTYHPAKKIVTNLLSGIEVEIDYDTPRCCDPSSELYWSM